MPLDEFLVQNGFVKTSLVTMKSDESVPYIKAYTKLGHSCYIELDSIVAGPCTSSERMRVSLKNTSIIPSPTKISVATCAKSIVCGVAFECNDEVCVLSPAQGEGYREVNMTISDLANSKTLVVAGSPIAYPVVRCSEVLKQPAQMICNIRDASHNIRCQAVAFNTKALADEISQVSALMESLKCLQARYCDVYTAFERETQFLENELVKWESCGSKGKEAICAEKAIIDNLRARSCLLDQTILNETKVINLGCEVSKMQNFVARSYAQLYLISRNFDVCGLSRSCLDPCRWGYPRELGSFDRELLSGNFPPQVCQWIVGYKNTKDEAATRLEYLKLACEQNR